MSGGSAFDSMGRYDEAAALAHQQERIAINAANVARIEARDRAEHALTVIAGPAWDRLMPPALVDLAANVTDAQAAGNAHYARYLAAGRPLEHCADAYHRAFVERMRELGSPMACGCNYCRAMK